MGITKIKIKNFKSIKNTVYDIDKNHFEIQCLNQRLSRILAEYAGVLLWMDEV